MNDSLTRAHHPYSPSSLQTREGCPKFQQREGPVHEMAVIGTMQHDSVESQLDDERLPDYRAQAVAECIRFGEERAKKFPGCLIIKEEYLPIDDEVLRIHYVEQFTNVDPDTGLESVGFRGATKTVHGTTAGYCDFCIVSADQKQAEVIDYKFGRNAVEDAANNVQGMSYALGLLKRFPTLEEITVIFIMPHLDFVSSHTFTRLDFVTMRLRVVTIVRRSIEAHSRPDDFSMATPNPSSCLFCGLIGKCPKVAEIALKVGKKYRPLEIPENISTAVFLDPEQVAKGIKLAAIIVAWGEAYKRQATAKTVDDVRFVPEGYILVESQKRVVKDARALGDLAKKKLGVLAPPDKLQALEQSVDACYDVAIGKLEKLLSTAAPRGQKETTVEAFGAEALELGVVELGAPFAFLRQSSKADGDKKTTDKTTEI